MEETPHACTQRFLTTHGGFFSHPVTIDSCDVHVEDKRSESVGIPTRYMRNIFEGRVQVPVDFSKSHRTISWEGHTLEVFSSKDGHKQSADHILAFMDEEACDQLLALGEKAKPLAQKWLKQLGFS